MFVTIVVSERPVTLIEGMGPRWAARAVDLSGERSPETWGAETARNLATILVREYLAAKGADDADGTGTGGGAAAGGTLTDSTGAAGADGAGAGPDEGPAGSAELRQPCGAAAGATP